MHSKSDNSEKKTTLFGHIKHLFLSGLFTILPLAATIFFVQFMYNIFDRIIEPLRQLEPLFLQKIPGAEFILVMLLIISVGILLKMFLANLLLSALEKTIAKLPIIRVVYSSAKIVVDFFKLPDAKTSLSKKVVLIPYPKKGQYHLAFLLESAADTYEKVIPDSAREYPGERYCKVFMPNSPNPTSGYFFIMPESDILPTDITFEEAVKALASCGLITPESLKKLH